MTDIAQDARVREAFSDIPARNSVCAGHPILGDDRSCDFSGRCHRHETEWRDHLISTILAVYRESLVTKDVREAAVDAAGNKLAELKRCDCAEHIGEPWHGGPEVTRCCLIHRVEAAFLLDVIAPLLTAQWVAKLAEAQKDIEALRAIEASLQAQLTIVGEDNVRDKAKLAEMEALVEKRSAQARNEKAKREAVEAERDRLKGILREIRKMFFWRQNPDRNNEHTIHHTCVQEVNGLCDAALNGGQP